MAVAKVGELPGRLLTSGILSALDQALLSAFNLLVAAAFIYFAPKHEYAQYALAMTGILLAQSLQNALVNSPLATVYPASSSEGRAAAMFAAGWAIHCLLTASVCLVGIGSAVVLHLMPGLGQSPSLVLSGTVAAAGILLREFARGGFFARHNALNAFTSDLAYVLTAAALVGLVTLYYPFSPVLVFLSIGAAGLSSSLISLSRLGVRITSFRLVKRETTDILWSCAKWAVPSVIVTWGYSNGYLYLVGYIAGNDAVADLSAARLFGTPLAMLVTAWSSVLRPRFSRLFSLGDFPSIDSLAFRSIAALFLCMFIYAAVALVAFGSLEQSEIGEKYGRLGPLVAAWVGFFAVVTLRSTGMALMLSAHRAYRTLFFFNFFPLAVVVPGTILASNYGSTLGVIVALGLGEAALAAVIWLFGWPRLRRGVRATMSSVICEPR
jgi:O-antigen/teichoic acid export membrane protein